MLVRVDDDVGIGPLGGGQMVVCYQHLQAQRFGMGHAFHAGNAVVHGDQQIRALVFDALGNRRGQTVAVHHAVRHQISHLLRAQQPQAAQGQRTGGGAVAVVIGDHAQAFVLGDRVGQQRGGLSDTQQAVGRQQLGQAVVEFVGAGNATGGVQARQKRVHAGLLQRIDAARRNVAGDDLHNDKSRSGKGVGDQAWRARASQPCVRAACTV